MEKQIHSVYKVDDDHFKFVFGTTNKKKPEVIYIELGTHITPLHSKDNYERDIEVLNEGIKKYFQKKTSDSQFLLNETIFDMDVAVERMDIHKLSYLSIQMFIKPVPALLSKSNFKEICQTLEKEYMPYILSNIKITLENNGFAYYKAKSDYLSKNSI